VKSKVFRVGLSVHGKGGEEEKCRGERENIGGLAAGGEEREGTREFTSLPLPTLFH